MNTDEIREEAALTSPSDREWWRSQLHKALDEIDRLEDQLRACGEENERLEKLIDSHSGLLTARHIEQRTKEACFYAATVDTKLFDPHADSDKVEKIRQAIIKSKP